MTLIKASNKLQDLSGQGLEWLLSDDGEFIRLEFYDGNIVRRGGTGNTDDTVTAITQ
jgi:hypothetical protein